ncbi:MAG: BamA/TamA family outer membrane protein [Microcystis sp. M54BS1]|nr:BamA/TamA family outer membrane protein [Microcystis aeruginosa PMC 728.11]MCA2504908.1 BamA/TamA family outer membrane protein [Microcystis sp. M62BS1]MCA2513294.1 BamA/TamA family outer membrane protein [Microcystis sp. M60BS1]MCA2515068.1 BamA/TamA family outer membrane protein [Microcystis sp. M59BS1]MCA2522191.1 BamA/TamA family outer membrane protein [Microcystis sp. M63BS1]MCA2526877.1 BamA/TamA family outer membrane protein [Microcystis sp. M61BS1]MCA2531282.1 BamA/TamA family oute
MEVLKNLNFSGRYSSLALLLAIFGLFHGTVMAEEEPQEMVFPRIEQIVQSPPATGETTPPVAAPPETPTEIPRPAETPTTAPPAQAEESRVLVAEVVVQGADRELENLVYNTIRTRPGRSATRSQLQEDINAVFATGFFADVRAVPQDTPLGVRVTFEVQPNPVFQGVQIQIAPETMDKSILPAGVVEEIFASQYGKTLNLRELQAGVKKINDWYSKNGYDLAQVIGAPQVTPDGRVILVISEGLIEKIQVRYFNVEQEPVKAKTREFIITREMRLKAGDIFNRNTAQQDLQRVFGLGLFEDVRLSFSPGSDPREVIVNVDVVEGNTGSLAAGGGISSNAGLFGTVSYQQRNFGGNNQTLGAEVQLGEREFLFDLSFSDPWIATDNFRTSYTVNVFRRQSISLVYDGENSSIRTLNDNDSPRIVRTGGGITFVRPLAPDVFTKPKWVVSLGFNYQQVQVQNANGDISPLSAPLNGFGSQQLAFSSSGIDDLLSLNIGAIRDFRDNPLQPTSGSFLRLGLEQTIPVGSGSIFGTRVRGSYSYFIPVRFINSFNLFETDIFKGQQSLAFNVQAGTVLGDLPPYDAFIVGGSNSVRGYAEGEVGSGRSYLQATAEYRFPIVAIIGGALFVDFGTTIGSQGDVPGQPGIVRDLPGIGLGYGLGVRVQSPVGQIRVDYGFNVDGGSRLHFGIGERF